MIKRLAIIPARSGSKRIKNKNIRNFHGKPIISYIIAEAISSGLFHKIHVSTDSEKIYDIACQYNLEFDFYRDPNLCDDITPIMPVLKFVLEKFIKMRINFDEVWCLMPCSPMITSFDLTEAAKIMRRNKSICPLLSVSEYNVPVEWAFKKNEADQLEPLNPGMFSIRSQDLSPSYFDAGAFSVFPSEWILNSNNAGSDKGFIGYPLSKLQSVDIDTEEDWFLAEALYQFKKNKSLK